MEEKLVQLRLSVSKTKTYEQCHKKFHFSYILKLPKVDRDYHIFGKFIHKILEDFHIFFINNKDSTEKPNIVMKNCYVSTLALDEFKEVTDEMKENAKPILNSYLKQENELKRQGKYPNVLKAEKVFSEDIDGKILLNGMIDKIQIDHDGVLHVIDYKTTKNPKYLKKDMFQLLTYAYIMLLEDPTLEKVRGSYLLLKHNCELITEEFTRDEILKIKDKYLKFYDDITNETEYAPKLHKLCDWCDYKDLCDPYIAKNKKNLDYGSIDWT